METRNPDQRPSSSATYYGNVTPSGVRVALAVRGLGVVIIHCGTDYRSQTGKPTVVGCATFTRDEIGFTEQLSGGM